MSNILLSLGVSDIHPVAFCRLQIDNIHTQLHIDYLSEQIDRKRTGWNNLIEESDLVKAVDFYVEKSGFFAKKKAIKTVQEAGRVIGCYFAFVEESGWTNFGESYYDDFSPSMGDPFKIKGKFYSFKKSEDSAIAL
jgi:hypothetical protein